MQFYFIKSIRFYWLKNTLFLKNAYELCLDAYLYLYLKKIFEVDGLKIVFIFVHIFGLHTPISFEIFIC